MTSGPLPDNRVTAAFERRVALALKAAVPSHLRLESMPLVVACSGGADSTAVLVAVSRSRGPDDVPIVAACFDHGLRSAEESMLDRLAVGTVANRLGERVLHGSMADLEGFGPPVESEESARNARYRWLADICAEVGTSCCVTGHTLDDQAETVLLRLTRGAGILGVSGMKTQATWPVPHEGSPLWLLRPLLGIRREETHAYIETLGLEPRVDSTNDLLKFQRNRIRHRVLPELRALNPQAEEALSTFADLARRDDQALEDWAEREAMALVDVHGNVAVIQRHNMLRLPVAVSSRILRHAGDAVEVVIDRQQIEELLRISGRRGARVSLSGGEAEVVDDELRITRHL